MPLLLAGHKEELLEGGHAGAYLAEHLESEARGRHGAIDVVDPEEGLANGEAPDLGELARLAEGHGGVKLGAGGHVARARTKVENVAVRVEEDVAGLAGEAETEAVVGGYGEGAGFGAGVEVGRYGSW